MDKKEKPSYATANLTLFVVCKDEWDMGDTGKSRLKMHFAYYGVRKIPPRG